MKTPMQEIGESFIALHVEIGALRWSLVRLIATLQDSGRLTASQIAECLDSRFVAPDSRQPEEIRLKIVRTVDDIRNQVASEANGRSNPPLAH
jgi:hypothetical protein